MNERFLEISWNKQGLRSQEPRADRTKYVSRYEQFADWNMEDVWDRLGCDEMSSRERLRFFDSTIKLSELYILFEKLSKCHMQILNGKRHMEKTQLYFSTSIEFHFKNLHYTTQ